MEKVVRLLLAPIVAELGVDVLEIYIGGGRQRKYLKIVVDRTGGVDSGILESLSRALSLQLDAEDLIRGSYQLEVSSPGFDWPLRTPEDFLRHQGEWLKVSFLDGTSLEGRNMGPSDAGFLVMDKQDIMHDIAKRDVARSVRAINWNGPGAERRNKKRS